MADLSSTTAVLLAAGMSSRFGSNKLLSILEDEPVVLHAARTLRRLPCAGHVAVCRDAHGEVATLLAAEGYLIAVNAASARGISSSIIAGLAASGDPSTVLLCLSDMPFVSVRHLRTLVDRLEPDGIVASSAGAGLSPSPPAVFSRRYFSELRALKGDVGARKLLSEAKIVFAPRSELLDIDVPDDLDRQTQRTLRP